MDLTHLLTNTAERASFCKIFDFTNEQMDRWDHIKGLHILVNEYCMIVQISAMQAVYQGINLLQSYIILLIY